MEDLVCPHRKGKTCNPLPTQSSDPRQQNIEYVIHMNASIGWTIVIVAAFVIAGLIAGGIRKNADRLNLVQAPNERSSHVKPTPSGGGVGIAVSGSIGAIVMALQIGAFGWIVLAATSCIALLGLLDDIYDLSSRLRFAMQIVLVAGLLVAAGEMPSLQLFQFMLPAPLLFACLLFAGVWWVNLFNFMDGVDGIAASESIFILAGAAFLALTHPDSTENAVWWWGVVVAAASGGFLTQNWPPAKIFMGDAGSNYLALAMFGQALFTIAAGWLSYAAWIILAALFVTDATVTLIRRILAGERWFSAHRQHGYQFLSRRWQSHRRVTVLCIGVNILWLLPLAYWAQTAPAISGWLVLVAYIPLVIAVIAAGAGTAETQTSTKRL